jgi:iron complex transport system ATP-binding protein
MLNVNNLSYKIQSRTLLQVNEMHWENSVFHAIIGPNGAGKSTLLKLCSGLLNPSTGNVSLNNKPLHQYSAAELARQRAVLMQQQDSPFNFSVQEIILMGRIPHFYRSPAKEDLEVVSSLVKNFQLEHLKNRTVQSLSGGERQRVHLARVIAQLIDPQKSNPFENKLLFLDEPGTWLDVAQQHLFMQQIMELIAQGLTVIAVLHELDLAARYAGQLHLLSSGRLLASGSASQILNSEILSSAYKTPLTVSPDTTGCPHVLPTLPGTAQKARNLWA